VPHGVALAAAAVDASDADAESEGAWDMLSETTEETSESESSVSLQSASDDE